MSKPVRMCIRCRERFDQDKLFRLQCKERRLLAYSGVGRSFYICSTCMKDTKLSKNLARICKIDPSTALEMLKEIVDNG